MNNETPFNPLPIPESLNLSLNDKAAQKQASPNKLKAKRSTKPNAEKKSTRTSRSGGTASRAISDESRWNRVKTKLAAKVALLNDEKLKAVLLACGVAAGMVAAIVIAIKLVPLGALLIATVGLGIALQIWNRLRQFPCPF